MLKHAVTILTINGVSMVICPICLAWLMWPDSRSHKCGSRVAPKYYCGFSQSWPNPAVVPHTHTGMHTAGDLVQADKVMVHANHRFTVVSHGERRLCHNQSRSRWVHKITWWCRTSRCTTSFSSILCERSRATVSWWSFLSGKDM